MLICRTKTFLQLLVAFAVLVPPLELLAQTKKLSFEKVLNDSAPGEVKVLRQDHEGYIWIGARNELLRYNAYEFQSIQYFDEASEQFRAPYFVTEIFEDSQNIIWVASHSGLFWFDADKEILVRPKTDDGIDDVYYTQPFQDIDETPSGHLIAGGEGYGLALINRNSYRIRPYRADPSNPQSLADDAFQRVLIDSKERIWVTTSRGLNLFNPGTNQFKLYVPFPENAGSKVHNSLISIMEDNEGQIWGGTLGQGLYVFNPETETFKHYRKNPEDPSSLADNNIWTIYKDAEDKIWLGHDRGGFSWYLPDIDGFRSFTYAGDKPGDMAYNAVTSILEDNNGDLWMGHYPEGISYHDTSTAAINVIVPDYMDPTTIANNNVLAIQEDKKGNLWLAVGNGVNYLDRKTNSYKFYDHANGGYGAHGTLSGYLDRHGTMWVGTWTQGFHRYNAEKDRFEEQPSDGGLAGTKEQESKILNDATIWAFCETSDGYLWIGTHYAGINKYNAKTKTYTRINATQSPIGNITNNIAWSCYEDSKGRFWVGTAYGVSMREPGRNQFTNYFPNEDDPHGLQSGSVLDILEDDKGQIWLGTNNGLHLYREETKDFKIFNLDHGFNNAGVRALTQDNEGNLWLGTNNGIIKFNPETMDVKNYLSHSGIRFAGVNTGAALKSSRGEILFGTVDGLIIIDTNKLTSNEIAPPIVFTDFEIFAKTVPVNGPENILSRVVNKTSSITLDYTKQMFSFEFAALNYRNPNRNHYAYKLEGFDREWREVGTERKAQYTNLEAGRYTFKVRASNNDGVWTESPKTINLVQLPPPWLTWWAYTLYGLAILAALAWFVRSQQQKRRRVEEQNKLLEIKVAERTADLAAKNKDIQTMLSNMKQGLFTIEEDGNIHHEYSAHLEEIFKSNEISGKNAFEFLFANSAESEDLIHQQQASLASIIGMDGINYEFNAHLLTSEYETNIANEKKVLSLDWSPILDDDEYVEKLMVSVRDVTELKILEREAAGKRQELEIIGQLLNINAKKYRSFIDSAMQYVEESKQHLEADSATDKAELIQKLFRAMHTIKGNSRAHGFTFIANAAHNAESRYSELKDKPDAWNLDLLEQDLEQVEAILKEYIQIYTEVLGRGGNKKRDEEGVWINHTDLKQIQETLVELKSTEPAAYQRINNVIVKSTTAPLSEVLELNITALASIAEELGKPAPKVGIDDGDFRVQEGSQNLLNDVFSHILRNAIDHGIEAPEERTQSGKPEAGNIHVGIHQDQSKVKIVVKDDGKGLNLESLYKKGVELGKWKDGETPSVEDIASLIFESGVSTKDSVSNISGRGVGMDAVKQFLKQKGGDIFIIPNAVNTYTYKPGETAAFVAFETHLIMPCDNFVSTSAQ